MLFILDTNVLIEVDRGNKRVIEEVSKILYSYPDQTPAVTSINYSEFYHGALNDLTVAEKATQFLGKFIFLDMNLKSSRIFAELRKAKVAASDLDMIIAAIVMAYNGTIITMDRNFEKIKGLRTIILG